MSQELFIKAIDFAAKKHENQRRKNAAQSPYINHPINVCRLINEIGKINDYVILSAAVLHDVVEDTGTSYDELVAEFGQEIADVVMEVTDDKTQSKVDRKKYQVAHAGRISYEAQTVKLGDKLNNLTNLSTDPPANWSRDVIQGYFIWASQVVKQMKGTNKFLESELDKVFSANIPSDINIEEALNQYYDNLC